MMASSDAIDIYLLTPVKRKSKVSGAILPGLLCLMLTKT